MLKFCKETAPLSSWRADFTGPHPLSAGTTRFTTTCADTLTSLLLATPIRNSSVERVSPFSSKYILPPFSPPDTTDSDQGSHFTAYTT